MRETTRDNIILGTFGCIIVIILTAAFLALQVFIALFAWNTFLVPYFGLPELTLWPALGCVLLLNMIGGAVRGTYTHTTKE
jgi:hypothetical protein